MSFFIISYDLKAPGRDYASLYSEIKRFQEWQHPMESMWLIYTNETANNIYNRIRPKMDDNDLLFVSELATRHWQGWLPRTCWDWIERLENNV